ncbi:MAG: hypothetical protein ACREAC_02960, partial [Blastocatellia bacterium]
VWPSLNATLIWALAMVDGKMAWDEWKKNSFARHAEVYPEVWYQTWSGPDTINSVNSGSPGKTTGGPGFAWTDFPVMNLHSHACALYSAAKLLGVEFTETGVTLAPKLPLGSYRFESPLLGLIKSSRGYEGWYEPLVGAGSWTIHLELPPEESKRIRKVEVNGSRALGSSVVGGAVRLKGWGGHGKPLRWSVLLD